MLKIDTQGLSKDYDEATGEYEPIERGEILESNFVKLLHKISHLKAPDSDSDCPPSINTTLPNGAYCCFFGDGEPGIVRCLDSKEEEMTPEIVMKLVSGELTLKEYDESKGHTSSLKVPLIVITFILVAVAFYAFGT